MSILNYFREGIREGNQQYVELEARRAARVPLRTQVRAWWKGLDRAQRIAWILALSAIIAGWEIGGTYTAAADLKGSAYVVNRFTGSVHFCAPNECRLIRHGTWPMLGPILD